MIKSSGAPFYGVLTADSQTGGRGRQGRSFFSPTGGIYFSAVYPISGREKHIPFFTLLTGLAVRRSLKEICGADTRIKWPNDIYLNGKKLCGILCELISRGENHCIICGVGINSSLSKNEVPPELADKMTSLSIEGIALPNKEVLIKNIVEALDSLVYSHSCLENIPEGLIGELNSFSFLSGKTVFYNGEKAVCGEINPDGSITLSFEDREERIFYGELAATQ